MSLQNLKTSLEHTRILKKGTYSYVVHPITDGIPEVQPELLADIVHEMKQLIQPFLPIDKIVTMEAMGIPLAAVLSQHLQVPYTIIRKRSYGMPNELRVKQKTGYSTSTFYINGLQPKDSIVIVDDVLSTGGTLLSIIHSLQTLNVNIKTVVIVIEKGHIARSITKKTGVSIASLVHIDVEKNKVIVQEESI